MTLENWPKRPSRFTVATVLTYEHFSVMPSKLKRKSVSEKEPDNIPLTMLRFVRDFPCF